MSVVSEMINALNVHEEMCGFFCYLQSSAVNPIVTVRSSEMEENELN